MASLGLYATDASALALGRLTVQSALGEPLRAEIELPELNPEDADSLRTVVASPEVYRTQGVEYAPALNNVRMQLERSPGGRFVLRLSSDRPINDPFVDLLLEANWASGRIVRNYTMLFDPPSMRQPQNTAVTAPQITPVPTPPPSAPAAATLPPPAVVERPAAAAPRPPATASAPATPAADEQVTVKPGDTLGRIAAAHKPADVSLDQMLVALQRSNPDAFIRGNINRIKAGSVLSVPDAAQAQATPASEARRIVAAQSHDFNEFRRRLANAAPRAQVAAAERSASGSVQAQVAEQKPSAATPDKLTLSKGAVQSGAAADRIAKDKQASDTSARIAELSKNINDLNKLGAASPAPAPAAAAPAPSAPASTTPAPAASAAPASPGVAAPQPAAAAPAPAAAPAAPATVPVPPPAPAPAPAAPSPAPVPKPVPRPPAPAPAPAPSFIDTLLEDPMIPLGAGLLVLLGIGYGAFRLVKRKRTASNVDSSFLESRLQPDSFFGASGGQRVDTNNESTTGGSSLAYSPSQLDAGGDVDPVAEADVYLAYGRDLQAEEILKEALRSNPARLAIHAKLAEIYSKRQDRRALEAIAMEARKLTQGQGPEWDRISHLGRELEPGNAMYQSGGAAGSASTAPAAAGGAFGVAIAAAPTPPAMPPELDLDLDLDLDMPPDLPDGIPLPTLTPAVAPLAPPPAAPAPAAIAPPPPVAPKRPAAPPPAAPAPTFRQVSAPAPLATEPLELGTIDVSAPVPLESPGMDLNFHIDDFDSMPAPPEPPRAAKPAAPAPSPSDSGMIEFDLNSLSLDLGPAHGASTATATDTMSDTATIESAPSDPLSTKLALAEEFNAIGDADGARALVEEVIAEASGDLRSRAQHMLATLG
ncbi:FimV/HubP family polar landmark protein [Ramlibacter sp. H39-3-26]|uniref:FimV/HubP family polar landmark protein n=1 Tax=Curvibacter soli TaxID=3031331 RepID=UPI0031F36B45